MKLLNNNDFISRNGKTDSSMHRRNKSRFSILNTDIVKLESKEYIPNSGT